MIDSFTKNGSTQERKIKNGFSDIMRSKIEINSKIQCFASPNQNQFSPLQILNEEKNVKKTFLEGSNKNHLEIILWNKDKTMKLVNYQCAANSNQFNNLTSNQDFESPFNQNTSNFSSFEKELGNVKIKIFECSNGELSYKFNFETLESSKVETKTNFDEQEIKWKGGKDDFDFKINLNQLVKKESWNSRFQEQSIGKENIFGSLFQPTPNHVITPSPKSCLIFRFLFLLKKNLIFFSSNFIFFNF